MSLTARAQRELSYTIDDPDIIQCYLEVVAAYEAKASLIDTDILKRLLDGEHVGEITRDKEDWIVSSPGVWQSVRNPNILSDDGGVTHFYLTDDTDEPVRLISSAPRKAES